MSQKVIVRIFALAAMITSFMATSKVVSGSATMVQQPEGCTIGYWKQSKHLDAWSPTGYSPTQTLESVFDVPDSLQLDNKTLLQALAFKGNKKIQGSAQNLLRAAVAALLNAAHPDVNYPRTTSDVISDVNAALASLNSSTILALANALDKDNNLSCPLAIPPTSMPTNTPTSTPTSTPTDTPTSTPTTNSP